MGENGLLEKVKQAINGNTTVKGLMKDLQGAGIKVNNELEAVILAEDYWIKINDIERGPLENYKVSELKELPFTSVRNNGIEYRIHGIVHGSPENKLSTETKKFIREETMKFNNPNNGEGCLLEEDFSRHFELEGLEENLKVSPIYSFNAFLYMLSNIRKLKAIANNPLSRDLYLIATENANRLSEINYKATQNINYIPLAREVYQRREFPMPLQINRKRLISGIYALNQNIIERYFDPLFFPASWEYFHLMKIFAKDRKLRTLHIVTGLGHEKEVVYYLNGRKSNWLESKMEKIFD